MDDVERYALSSLGVADSTEAKGMAPHDVYLLLQTLSPKKQTNVKQYLRRLGLHRNEKWKVLWPDYRKNLSSWFSLQAGLGASSKGLHKQVRQGVLAAVEFLDLREEEEIKERPLESLYEALAVVEDKGRRKRLLHGINAILCAVRRTEQLDHVRVTEMALSNNWTKGEMRWFDENNSPQWYRMFKQGFMGWIKRRAEICGWSLRTAHIYSSAACIVVRCANVDILACENKPEVLGEATISVVVTAVQKDRRSLVNMKRGHRTGKALDPLKGVVDTYHTSLRILFQFFSLSDSHVPHKREIYHRATHKYRTVAGDKSESLEPPPDEVLTPAEVEAIRAQCKNEKQRLVVALLSKLGMRIDQDGMHLVHTVPKKGQSKDYG